VGTILRVAVPLGCCVSSAGERCLSWPILDETAHSCPLVLGGEQPGEVQPLDLEPGEPSPAAR